MAEQLAFDDLAEGRNLRDMAFQTLEQRRKEYVAAATQVAIGLIVRQGRVTVDDLRRVYPPDSDFDARVLGRVLAGKAFQKVGNTQTTRKTSHARPIGIFGLAS